LSSYNTGTVSVSNGSAVVAGSGTAWAVALVAGGMLSSAGLAVPIASVDNDTSLTLDYPWPGTTASGAAYSIALENSEAASVVEMNALIARILRTLSLVGIHPNESGNLAKRDALTLTSDDEGYLYLHAEVGVAFAVYRWTGSAWDGPFTVADAVAGGGVSSLVAGANVTIDNTNPAIPVISATGVPVEQAIHAATAKATPNDADEMGLVNSVAGAWNLRKWTWANLKATLKTYLDTLYLSTALARREVLTANRVYYVRTDGSNSNNGLSNTSGGAFLTLQKAMDVIAGTLDMAGFTVTVQIADGTYTTPLVIKACVGMASPSSLLFQGNTTTPNNVVLSTTSATAVTASGPNAFASIASFKIQTTTSGMGVTADSGAQVLMNKINFGAVANYQINCFSGAFVSISGNYEISGGCTFHIYCSSGFVFCAVVGTVTLTGTPAITTFAYAEQSGVIRINGNTYSGSATGTRYNVNTNGNIFTNGGGASYLPGGTAGSTSTGGNYT